MEGINNIKKNKLDDIFNNNNNKNQNLIEPKTQQLLNNNISINSNTNNKNNINGNLMVQTNNPTIVSKSNQIVQDKLSYQDQLNLLNEDIKEKWIKKQMEIQAKRVKTNINKDFLSKIKYIGGLDISFSKKNKDIGFVGLVVIDKQSFKIVYEDYKQIKLTEPYIPSFLAFREVEHYKNILLDLKNHNNKDKQKFYPDVILLDGNGIIHPRNCGIATHLGVELNIPAIGCAKTMFYVDGLSANKVLCLSKKCKNVGEYVKLIGKSGFTWGAALKTYFGDINDFNYSNNNYNEEQELKCLNNCVIISEGHLIDLETSINVVNLFNNINEEKVPYPVYLADKFSRKKVFNYDKKFIN